MPAPLRKKRDKTVGSQYIAGKSPYRRRRRKRKDGTFLTDNPPITYVLLGFAEFFMKYSRKRGRTPTVIEVAERTGLHFSSVAEHFRNCVRTGLLKPKKILHELHYPDFSKEDNRPVVGPKSRYSPFYELGKEVYFREKDKLKNHK
jgi:hypothetical protein